MPIGMKFDKKLTVLIFLIIQTTIPLLYSQQSEEQTKARKEIINPKILELPDGYYKYSIKRVRDAVEVEELYKQSGADISIDVIEEFSQLAIYIKNRSFTDPSLGIKIRVDNNGYLSSSDSSDLKGQLLSSGEIKWSGTVLEGEFYRYVESSCRLVLISDNDRADSSYDGLYLLAAEVFDKEMKVIIKDGLLTFEWIGSDQFKKLYGESAYLIDPDGSFVYNWEMLFRMIMNIGTYESVTDSITTIIHEGRISPGGIVFCNITRSSSGTDTLGIDDRQVYAGIKISESEHSNNNSDVLSSNITPPDRTDNPNWYILPEPKPGYLVSQGSHSHSNRETALRLAEITASSNMSYQIHTEIRAFFNTYQKKSEMNDSAISGVTEVIEQISTLFFPVSLDKCIYNSNSKTAYAQVSVSQKEKESVIRKLLTENQIDPDLFVE